MKVVYVAGPIRAKTRWEREQNIRRAEEVSLEIWRMGAVAICPHAMSRFYGEDDLPFEAWIAGDLELVRRSDAVFAVEGWENSVGAKMEVNEAFAAGVPVFAVSEDRLEELRRWLNPGPSAVREVEHAAERSRNSVPPTETRNRPDRPDPRRPLRVLRYDDPIAALRRVLADVAASSPRHARMITEELARPESRERREARP